MTMATLTLTEFLLARIAEDDDYLDAHTRDCEHMNGTYIDGLGPLSTDCDCGYPARVLREVQAKRRIVEMHEPYEQIYYVRATDDFASAGTACGYCRDDEHDRPAAYPCATLRILALPYADHPDYRPEWKP